MQQAINMKYKVTCAVLWKLRLWGVTPVDKNNKKTKLN